MRILILGAGQVGSSVAASLAGEANDITIVDSNPDALRHLQEHFDLRTLTGFASHPDVLRRAGAERADMLLAVTNSDETNMIACQVAFHLFNTPTRIARVRARSYLSQQALFEPGCLAIDELISPEQEVTNHIERIIEYPGTLQVLEFADGIVLMVAVRAYHGGPLVGHALRTLNDHLPTVDARVAAIYRRGRAIIPNGDTVIEADDEVFFVAARKDIWNVLGELRNRESRVRTVMLAGGGNIGRRLAQALEPSYRVKLIERSEKVVTRLSEELDRTVVLRGDAADEDLLLEENIDRTDVFCAVTNDDQANILSAMLAKRLGAGKVMSLINRGCTRTSCRATASTSRSLPPRPPSAPCSRACGAATWSRSTPCGAVRRRPSRPSRTAPGTPRGWSAGRSTPSTSLRTRPSPPWCVTAKSSWRTTTRSSRRTTTSSCSCWTSDGCRTSSSSSRSRRRCTTHREVHRLERGWPACLTNFRREDGRRTPMLSVPERMIVPEP